MMLGMVVVALEMFSKFSVTPNITQNDTIDIVASVMSILR